MEVEFLEMYNGQPLFGDVCAELSKHGFEFFDFVNIARWERGAHNTFGQSIFADGLFLRTPESLNYDEITQQKLASYLTILIAYRRIDLVDKVIAEVKRLNCFDLRDFEKAFGRVRRGSERVRLLVNFADKIISLCGNGTRLHLLH